MKKIKVKVSLLFMFILLFSRLNVFPMNAIPVGYGVEWTWGGNYFTTVWSQTNNTEGRVSSVRASVKKNGVVSRSSWNRRQAYASAGGWGHAEAWFNYR